MKKNKRIQLTHWSLIATLIAIVSIGCSYQRRYKAPTIGMPEQIYINAPVSTHYTPRILICPFRSPDYAPTMGSKAALSLSSEILKTGLRTDIIPCDPSASTKPSDLIKQAGEKRCEYIITGDILYAFDGGITRESSVVQDIKVYRTAGRTLITIGHAQATETAPVLASTDYIFVEGKGQPAPSAERLMERNSSKFALFLSHIFAGPSRQE